MATCTPHLRARSGHLLHRYYRAGSIRRDAHNGRTCLARPPRTWLRRSQELPTETKIVGHVLHSAQVAESEGGQQGRIVFCTNCGSYDWERPVALLRNCAVPTATSTQTRCSLAGRFPRRSGYLKELRLSQHRPLTSTAEAVEARQRGSTKQTA